MNKAKGCIVCAAPGFKLIGGVGSYTYNLVKFFSNEGWAVHCLATNDRSDNYNIQQFSQSFHDLSQIPLSPKKVFLATDIINKINPNVILLNHCALAQYTLPLLNKTIKPVAVIHSDDSRYYRTATIFNDRVFRWIAPTSGVGKGVSNYAGAINSNRISIIPHGIDNVLFSGQGRNKESKGRITFVGYIAQNKGADLLLPIMKRVVLKHPDCHITVVGYGPLQDTLAQQFRESGLEKNLTITGKVFPEKVADILKCSDVFLLPTRIEGFGLVIAEAMMSGVVPVVSRLAGITDTIATNNETGMLVEVDDVEGFSFAIIELLSNPDRLSSMMHAAQKVAQEKFTIQRMINDYERLFAEEDNRPTLPKRGVTGWVFETVREMLRKNPNGTYRFKKKFGTFKNMLLSSARKTITERNIE
jgi:glycosyltransferase involved in cell wall biosynthesis